MGIDLIRGGRIANRGFRKTKSSNAYLKSLIQVLTFLFSSTPSSAGEPMLNSIKWFINDLTNQDSIATHSHFPELSSTSLKTAILNIKITSSIALLLSLVPSPTISDSSIFQKDLEFVLSSSPLEQEPEFKNLREPVTLGTNLPSWLLLARESCCWEVLAIERPSVSSAPDLDKRAHTQLLALEQRVVNSSVLEAEDDSYPI